MIKYNSLFQAIRGQLLSYAQVRPFQLPELNLQDAILKLNRNARAPKNVNLIIQANHGKRPCSSVMRKLKKK